MTSATNNDKTPLSTSIAKRIFGDNDQQDERQPKGLPVKITGFGTNKTTVKIQFVTDQTFTLPTDIEIPINGTRYMRYPWQIGDYGYVVPSQIDTGVGNGFSTNAQAAFGIMANLAGMVFHPLGSMSFDPPDDPDAVQHNGPSGTINRPDNKASQAKTSSDGSSTSQGGGDGNGNFQHSSTSGPNQVTHSSTSKVGTSAPTHEVSQNQTVGGSNMVTGPITSSTSVAAPSGSFASGSMGGMSLSGGIISAIGSTLQMIFGNSGSGGTTPSQLGADLVNTTGYTTAQLLALTGMSQGARAFVKDVSTSPPFGSVVTSGSGGGTGCRPVFYTGPTPNNGWVYA